MTSPSGSALCACGEPATGRSRKRGTPRCVDCSNEVAAQAAREMRAHSGPAWEAWQTAGGPDGFAIARSSPRVHAARLANLEKARAANARRLAAESPADPGLVPVDPAPVSPPSAPRAVPAVVFRPPW